MIIDYNHKIHYLIATQYADIQSRLSG